MESGDFKAVMGTVIAYLKEIARNTNNNACCTATVSAGSGTSVPAGFNYVSITQTAAGIIAITMPNGTVYTLSAVGQSFTLQTPIYSSLPAFAVSAGGGATWEWVGMN
jgi:hypothetical protein